MSVIDKEGTILEVLPPHPRIIGFMGRDPAGLKLEYATNGAVGSFVKANTEITVKTKLKWIQQAAEGIAHIHRHNIIHCDISLYNILLDANLDVKIADFQGKLVGPDGEYLIDCQTMSCTQWDMPRPDPSIASVNSDIFALGSSIYALMKGHEPFPELDSDLNDDDEAEVIRRYKEGEFPSLEPELAGETASKCWRQWYDSADEVVQEVLALEGHYDTREEIGGSILARLMGFYDTGWRWAAFAWNQLYPVVPARK